MIRCAVIIVSVSAFSAVVPAGIFHIQTEIHRVVCSSGQKLVMCHTGEGRIVTFIVSVAGMDVIISGIVTASGKHKKEQHPEKPHNGRI